MTRQVLVLCESRIVLDIPVFTSHEIYIRICASREVNKAVIRERCVLPKVDDTLHALRGCKYFAKIEAKSVFFVFQLKLAEGSR